MWPIHSSCCCYHYVLVLVLVFKGYPGYGETKKQRPKFQGLKTDQMHFSLCGSMASLNKRLRNLGYYYFALLPWHSALFLSVPRVLRKPTDKRVIYSYLHDSRNITSLLLTFPLTRSHYTHPATQETDKCALTACPGRRNSGLKIILSATYIFPILTTNKYLYQSNNSQLLCFVIPSNYLIWFPFSIGSRDRFVILKMALS